MSQQSYNTVLRWKSSLRIVSCNITFSCETPRNCRGVYLSFQVELKFEQVGFEEKSEKRSTWKRISLSIDPTITLPLRLLPHDYTNSMRMKKTSVDPVRQFSCFYFCACVSPWPGRALVWVGHLFLVSLLASVCLRRVRQPFIQTNSIGRRL